MKSSDQAPQVVQKPARLLTAPHELGERADFEKVVEAALLDRQGAIHIAFADGELRIDHQTTVQGRVIQPDDDLGSVFILDAVLAAMCIDDDQPPPSGRCAEPMLQAASDQAPLASTIRKQPSGWDKQIAVQI